MPFTLPRPSTRNEGSLCDHEEREMQRRWRRFRQHPQEPNDRRLQPGTGQAQSGREAQPAPVPAAQIAMNEAKLASTHTRAHSTHTSRFCHIYLLRSEAQVLGPVAEGVAPEAVVDARSEVHVKLTVLAQQRHALSTERRCAVQGNW